MALIHAVREFENGKHEQATEDAHSPAKVVSYEPSQSRDQEQEHAVAESVEASAKSPLNFLHALILFHLSVLVVQSHNVVQESSMPSWPNHLPSGNQKRF
jgi:hypothetical protein